MKKQLQLIAYALPLGAASGLFVWIFLKLMSVGMEFLWETVPMRMSGRVYPIVVCTLGGLLTGLFRKRFGDYPEELMKVLGTVKQKQWYGYRVLPVLGVAALLPLLFGSSVGPEAGLTGIIAALCYWCADSFRALYNGIALSALPPKAEREGTVQELPKPFRILLYLLTLVVSFAAYRGLSAVFGKGMGGFPRFALGVPHGYDFAMLPVYILAGCLMAKFYALTHHGCHTMAGKLPPVIREGAAGLCLGLAGAFVPMTMFSGEAEMHHLMTAFVHYLPWMLVVIALLKVLFTNICIQGGMKGGHFFPLIFAGVCMGYAIAMLVFPESAEHVVFGAAVVTSALLGGQMQKPVIVILLLLICFPIPMVPWIAVGAFAGSKLTSISLKKKTA